MIRVNRMLGHARIRRELKPHGTGVATGEHTHEPYDAVELFRLICPAGVTEVLTVLMVAKLGKAVYPYASGVGLCEYVIHPRWM